MSDLIYGPQRFSDVFFTDLRTETQATRVPRHVSPPPEDDFEFSRDKAEENARALLRDYRDEVSGLI